MNSIIPTNPFEKKKLASYLQGDRYRIGLSSPFTMPFVTLVVAVATEYFNEQRAVVGIYLTLFARLTWAPPQWKTA